jgi:hypothetical protein
LFESCGTTENSTESKEKVQHQNSHVKEYCSSSQQKLEVLEKLLAVKDHQIDSIISLMEQQLAVKDRQLEIFFQHLQRRTG